MSRVAEPALLRPSRLLEREPYILSDPADPSTPTVAGPLRAILDNRARALQAFFVPLVLQELRAHLWVDRGLDLLTNMGIHVSCSPELRAYLLRHVDLVEPVRVIGHAARELVLRGDEVALELYRDPEVHDEYLALYIRRRDYDPGTLELIGRVSDVAERVLAGASGWVLVTTDFKPPTRA